MRTVLNMPRTELIISMLTYLNFSGNNMAVKRSAKNVQECAVQIQQRIQTNRQFGMARYIINRYHRAGERVGDKHKRKS